MTKKEKRTEIIIKKEVDGEELTFTFREPSKLLYSTIIKNIQKSDYYSAIDAFIKTCFIDIGCYNLIDDEQLKVSLSTDIIEKVFNFKHIDVVDDYNGDVEYDNLKKQHRTIITLTIDNEKVFFKTLGRNDYREVFNRSIASPIAGLDYVYSKLKVGGADISKNVLSYVSCMQLTDFMLKYREKVVKKK